MELVAQGQLIGWQLPEVGEFKRWAKKLYLLILFALFCLLLPSVVVMAGGFGGLASEYLMGRTGVANSQLLLGRTGVDNSALDVGLAPIVSTLVASNVTMDASGTHATLRGNVTDLNGFPAATVWFEWGYDTTYGNIAGVQTATGVGTYTTTINNFQPDRNVHYRFAGQTDGTLRGSDVVFLARGTPVFNLVNYVVPLVFVAMLILLLWGLLKSDMPVVLIVVIGGLAIYIGINFLEAIVEALKQLW